ncbi:hypothetical protein [uncultured Clostridium sp.]|uniref:hypothetical protein n=1 Tax=uncultured Clostridium sp. TaxID=59620 RepID=UPI0025FE1E04|nr:hypothetical protein [uncultured Clostridium sp.]
MKNKILAISISVLVFLCATMYWNYKIIRENKSDKSYQSDLERKEMFSMDSLRYKFL